jgi:hypothetical protein
MLMNSRPREGAKKRPIGMRYFSKTFFKAAD